MTNLDSILKSRDITVPTKVCLIKAMVFPAVMYGCESWTIKRKVSTEELMLLNCVVGGESGRIGVTETKRREELMLANSTGR